MTDLRKVLASNMKQYRNTLGLSQAGLAEKVNTASNYIALIETCKRFPSVKMLERIAEALEIDTPELFSLKILRKIQKKMLREEILAEIERILIHKMDKLDEFA